VHPQHCKKKKKGTVEYLRTSKVIDHTALSKKGNQVIKYTILNEKIFTQLSFITLN
jgi:hypothetical protein